MSKHTISMDDATWRAMVERAGRIGLDRDGRPLPVSAYLRELHERDVRRIVVPPPIRRTAEVANEQSTRTDAQPAGQSGSAGRPDPAPTKRVVPRVRKAGKQATGKKGGARHPQAEVEQGASMVGLRSPDHAESNDLGECAKCSNRATREHYPYCSKKCAS